MLTKKDNPHRGGAASPALARSEDNALRRIHHGWQCGIFDEDSAWGSVIRATRTTLE